MSGETAPPIVIPWIHTPELPEGETGLINLGAANNGAITRLAIYAQQSINSYTKDKKPLPPSPFVEWAADRVCGEDRQDLVLFLQGRRGSGKSYSVLYLGKRLGEAIARRMGGTWTDYFSLNNCATLEDTENVLKLTNSAGKYQVVLVDDCSLAISNRSWNSQQNRNFNALLSVCRTNRWILLLTAPLKKHVDNQTRDMCDITATVHKSFHKGGFNIIKMTSADISTSGKEYNRRLNFGGKKVSFWVAFKPDKSLTKAYDLRRDESARELNARIVDTGKFNGGACKTKVPKTAVGRNTDVYIKEHGEQIKQIIKDNPGINRNRLSAITGISQQPLERVLFQMGVELKTRKYTVKDGLK